MRTQLKRCLSMLITIVMMFTLLAGSIMAAETSAESEPMPYLVNPVFYGAKLYAKKTNSLTKELVATADWSYGAPQAGIIQIPYDKYVEVSASGKYDSWYIIYTGNSKDATYMRIHNGGSETYDTMSFKSPNTNFTSHVIIPGLSSKDSLYIDWTVGFTAHNIPMGGLEVKLP